MPDTTLKQLRITLLAALITLVAACAHQNSSDSSVSTEESDAEQVEMHSGELQSIVVTGARIPSKDVETSSSKPLNTLLDQTRMEAARAPATRSVTEQQFALARKAPTAFHYRPPVTPPDRENYAHYRANPLRDPQQDPVSTFSIDVDTGAYANVRRMLNEGRFPPADAVRAEELINYFDYKYTGPVADRAQEHPFAMITEIAPSPWRDNAHLLHVGIKGYEPEQEERPAANLVFLIDVSGSMQSPDKLELLKKSMKLLTKQLTNQDSVAIVVYAGAAGEVLEPTAGSDYRAISDAIDRLQAGGSTNGGAGIDLAYRLAEKSYIKNGINRVIIATDGDFNVGLVDFEKLKSLISQKRRTGIALTTLGFGTGNYNDHLMEQLADVGNGNYFYIDTLNEGRKVLVEELQATLEIIAKDVKIQIEFNPAIVATYRLIGYENRVLNREDFNNDKVDAGEIGAGHTVTALYEITLAGESNPLIDPLRYSKPTQSEDKQQSFHNQEIAFLKLRYKQPNADVSRLITQPLLLSQRLQRFADASDAFKFSAAVAGFAQKLKGGLFLDDDFDYQQIAALAGKARGQDPHGYRSEFQQLVRIAQSLDEIRQQAAR